MRTDELTQAIHPQPVRPEPFDYAQDGLVEGLTTNGARAGKQIHAYR